MGKKYKVLITTSGTGSRLGGLTKKTNKALILLKDKPIIDSIINCYPKNIELVFTLGYFGNKVQKYLKKHFSDRKLTFVWVDKYQGNGSSLGYSLLQAKDNLQCPFIFHCNDTLVNEEIPSPVNFNWSGGSKGLDVKIFNTNFLSSFTIDHNNYIKNINNKGATKWDLFHIGLIGIKDYQAFWEALELKYQENPTDQSLNDCVAIRSMLNSGIKFKAINFKKWLDTGNPESLAHAQKY